jgi:hypothetical protein
MLLQNTVLLNTRIHRWLRLLRLYSILEEIYHRIGVSALCWSVWNYRNDIIFNKNDSTNFLQFIHTMVHWI